MILKNNIGWCDVTANPGIGCRGFELGDDCYAKFDTPARVLRAGKWPGYKGQKIETFGPGRTFIPTQKGLSILERLSKLFICDTCHNTFTLAQAAGALGKCTYCDLGRGTIRRIRLFADSNSDWMDWPTKTLAESIERIGNSQNTDVILLTKWPELFSRNIEAAQDYHFDHGSRDCAGWLSDWRKYGIAPKNVWTLTSVLTQKSADRRVPALLDIPSNMRGLSIEPLWDRVELEPHWLGAGGRSGENYQQPQIKWVIVGCDSSKNRKGWKDYNRNELSVIQQCAAAGVACYHKQMPINGRVSLKMSEWPKEFQVRQFPQTNP